ncbi:MAG: M14 family metallopeptidase [Candidatus Paceibacteria bacterium]
MLSNSYLNRYPIAVLIFGTALIIGILAVGYFFFIKETVPETIDSFTESEAVVESAVRTQVLGQSVENRDVTIYSFGDGLSNVLFVGGVHGGYEWNSVLLAEAMIEYFTFNLELIPSDLTVNIIPVLNPDGLAMVTDGKTENLHATEITGWSSDGTGRFNANGVDLNRNFACKWQPQASWRGNAIPAGTVAFSEPEAQILRDYVLTTTPKAVVFWHSVAGAVYGSECEDGILPATLDIMNAYAVASSYGAVPIFDAYPVTGDAEGWLASIGIPAVTVELETRNSIEWQRNLAGTKAVLELISSF